jgi:hypothetical protein
LKLAALMPYCLWMLSHVLPSTTICHLLHAQMAPGCVGVGALVQPAVVVGVVG